jgi:acyl carrier protein
MTRDSVIATVREFLVREVLEGSDVGLDESTLLLELGLLNSLSVLLLLDEIEAQLGVAVPRDAVTPENLRDMGTIADMVLRTAGAPSP